MTASQWSGRCAPPYAFTEQGVAMLSSVLNSPRAVQVNIEIMRTFVRLRRLLAAYVDLAERLEELERKYDGQFKVVFEAIRQLMEPEKKERKAIRFKVEEEMGRRTCNEFFLDVAWQGTPLSPSQGPRGESAG